MSKYSENKTDDRYIIDVQRSPHFQLFSIQYQDSKMYYNPTPSPISPASYMDPVPETGVTSIEQRYPMSSHNGVVIRSTETVSNEADSPPQQL